MRRRKNSKRGTILIACAAGLLLSFVCPAEFLVVVLTITLIIMGISCFFC